MSNREPGYTLEAVEAAGRRNAAVFVFGRYGFPSEIVDDPVLDDAEAQPDAFVHAEERRLFYRAVLEGARRRPDGAARWAQCLTEGGANARLVERRRGGSS